MIWPSSHRPTGRVVCRRDPQEAFCVAHGSPFARNARLCERARTQPDAVAYRSAAFHIGIYRDWRFGYYSAYYDGWHYAFWLGPLCVE